MDDQKDIDWLAHLRELKSQYADYLIELKRAYEQLGFTEPERPQRKLGEFRYLELPTLLDNFLATLESVRTTTEITDHLLRGRGVDEETWVLINRRVSGLLNARVKQGRVRKIGRVQGGNRSFLWERLT